LFLEIKNKKKKRKKRKENSPIENTEKLKSVTGNEISVQPKFSFLAWKGYVLFLFFFAVVTSKGTNA